MCRRGEACHSITNVSCGAARVPVHARPPSHIYRNEWLQVRVIFFPPNVKSTPARPAVRENAVKSGTTLPAKLFADPRRNVCTNPGEQMTNENVMDLR